METNSVHDYSQYQSAGDMQSPAAFQQPQSSNVDKSPGGVILGLLSAVLSGAVGYYNNERQREEQRYLMERSAELNRLQWERENAYNTPAAQMQRFREAGLNPNMVLGKDATSGNMTPSQNVPAAHKLDNWFATGVQSFRQMEMEQAQIENINADTDKKRVEAGATVDRVQLERELKDNSIKYTDALIEDMVSKQELRGVKAELMRSQMNQISQWINQSIAQENFLNEQADLVHKKNEHFEEEFQTNMDNILSQTNLNKEKIAEIKRDIWEKVQTFQERRNNLISQTNLNNASAEEKKAVAMKMQAEVMSMAGDILRNMEAYGIVEQAIKSGNYHDYGIRGTGSSVAMTVASVILDMFGFKTIVR